MNILFLADAVFADKPGGSRVVARELARGLAAKGHRVTFLVGRQTPEPPDDETTGNIRIVRYGGAGQHKVFMDKGREAAARLWAQEKFDIVHTHFAYAAEGPSAVCPEGTVHIRSFYGPWDTEGYVEDTARVNAAKSPVTKAKALLQREVKRRMRHSIEANSLNRSRAVIVLSEQSRGEVHEFNYPDNQMHLIAGGVDVDRFTPAAEGKAAVRQRLGLPTGRPILFSVRRLAPRMGLDNLIRAMKSIVAGQPEALLLIGGKGPERERLEALVNELGLGTNVRFLGFIPDEQLADYYRAADLFVLPTTALEGFGLVTVEALSSGTPAVGTPIGATPEILGALDRRLLAASSGHGDIATAVLGFLNGSWRGELTPERLRDFVLERYTWDRHVNAVEALYEKHLGEAKSA
jgi:glycosyltransferase involved in cell wall biosynthesis